MTGECRPLKCDLVPLNCGHWSKDAPDGNRVPQTSNRRRPTYKNTDKKIGFTPLPGCICNIFSAEFTRNRSVKENVTSGTNVYFKSICSWVSFWFQASLFSLQSLFHITFFCQTNIPRSKYTLFSCKCPSWRQIKGSFMSRWIIDPVLLISSLCWLYNHLM